MPAGPGVCATMQDGDSPLLPSHAVRGLGTSACLPKQQPRG